MNFSKEESFSLFSQAIEGVENSNAFTCEGEIDKLVRCINAVEELQRFVRSCSKSCDYEEDLKDMLSSPTLTLPQYQRHIVAVVSYLFFCSYNKTFSLFSIISEAYPAVSLTGKYKLFLDNVVTPYKNAFRELFFDNVDENIEPKALDVSEQVAKSKFIVLEEIGKAKQDFMNVSKDVGGLTAQDLTELRFIIDSLYEGVFGDNSRMVRLAAIAINNTFSSFRRFRPIIKALNEMLEKYNMI